MRDLNMRRYLRNIERP